MKKLFLTLLFSLFLVSPLWADGNDSNTVSLLHKDGPDTSTTFTDDAAGGTHTWTASGNAQIDTAQSKFGGASGLFDGNGDYISSADSADWYFGTGDFTIDLWVRYNTLPADQGNYALWDQIVTNNDNIAFVFWNDAGTYYYQIWAKGGGVALINVNKAASSPAINTWYHIAFVRNGNNFMIFQDGTQLGTTDTDTDEMPDIAASASIGAELASTIRYYMDGWIDELRVSKGIARWTANFTPPTEAYSVAAGAAPSGQVIMINTGQN